MDRSLSPLLKKVRLPGFVGYHIAGEKRPPNTHGATRNTYSIYVNKKSLVIKAGLPSGLMRLSCHLDRALRRWPLISYRSRLREK